MGKNDKENSARGFDSWYRKIKEQAKNISDDKFDEGLDEIISQLEKGDYSSLDPELRREIEERERKEKNKKVAKPKRKEVTI